MNLRFTTASRVRPALPCMWVALSVCACRGEPEPPVEPAETVPSTALSATAAPSAAAQGKRWLGVYDAQRGKVEVPEGVRYDAWNDDDGKSRSGKGSIEIAVADDGEVTGSARGALGEQQLRGRLVDGSLETGLTPVDPLAEGAMSGVLTGEVEGERIRAELRVASGDARIVRQARVTLRRP